MDDVALYAQVQRGDRAALAMLVERYQRPLLAFLYRMTGDVAAAEDLTQETFLRLLANRGRCPDDFRPWVYAVACNLARDRFRRAAFRRERDHAFDEDPPVAPVDSVEHLAGQMEDRQAVAHALQELPVTLREVLLLRFYHDLSLEAIATATSTPLGTVKSRLYRALRLLKKVFEQEATFHEGN